MTRISYEVDLGSRIHGAFMKLFDYNPTMIEDSLSHVGLEDCTASTKELTAMQRTIPRQY
jgi:hypothetical protein